MRALGGKPVAAAAARQWYPAAARPAGIVAKVRKLPQSARRGPAEDASDDALYYVLKLIR